MASGNGRTCSLVTATAGAWRPRAGRPCGAAHGPTLTRRRPAGRAACSVLGRAGAIRPRQATWPTAAPANGGGHREGERARPRSPELRGPRPGPRGAEHGPWPPGGGSSARPSHRGSAHWGPEGPGRGAAWAGTVTTWLPARRTGNFQAGGWTPRVLCARPRHRLWTGGFRATFGPATAWEEGKEPRQNPATSGIDDFHFLLRS